MDPDEFAREAEGVLVVLRDALGRIEEAAQEGDDPRWHDLSRRFAVMVSPIREYLNARALGRDLPSALARRLEPLLLELDTAEAAVEETGLRDHVGVVRRLVALARARSP